jgi:hypothetical protein
VGWLDIEREDEPEQIDDPSQPYGELTRSMRDVACSNRWLGGTHAVLSHVRRLLTGAQPGSRIRILDIATGSADIPSALLAWGARRGLNLTVVGVDNHLGMLRMAREQSPGVHLVQADALALPFPPKSFDIALCALAFHHMGFDGSARVLAAMDGLTTRGFVVTDLRRDRPTLYGVTAALALIRAHPFTRHDGPASVRRAFTPMEYRKMVGLSGVSGVRVHTHAYYRVVLTQDKRQIAPGWV